MKLLNFPATCTLLLLTLIACGYFFGNIHGYSEAKRTDAPAIRTAARVQRDYDLVQSWEGWHRACKEPRVTCPEDGRTIIYHVTWK